MHLINFERNPIIGMLEDFFILLFHGGFSPAKTATDLGWAGTPALTENGR